MKDNIVDIFFGFACLCIVGFMMYQVGSGTAELDWKQEAIKRGVAEYVMNPETGRTTWRWKQEFPRKQSNDTAKHD